jgi:methionyl-tRNA formyltransferase
VGSDVKIVFLTTADPIYLPEFFKPVLDAYGEQTQAVYVVPPLYKDQTRIQAVRRYCQTFGLQGVIGLVWRLLQVKFKRHSIEAVCKERGVRAAAVRNVNAPEFLEDLSEMSPDVIVSVSCPQIFKKTLIELPPMGCLNIHGSILPNYRGIMPSFWMLANGERRAGVSIYFVNEQIDAGDLCGQRVFGIEPTETLDKFLRRSKAVAADLLLEVLDAIERGTITRTPLDLTQGRLYSWPDKESVERFRASGRRLW